MQKVNVSHSQTKINKTVRRRQVPCVGRSRYRGRIILDAVLMSMERKKEMKKQRRSKEKEMTKKVFLKVA
jgi:hypothetical protein